ncbi:hypothetical protein [Clostridium tertium]|uniref:VWFA domain-containing protein n=1 Tax=Clostridium tertium TaxID=1559 RepID=A0A6N2Y7Z7_9CLOT
MDKKNSEILRQYQCDYNRELEESFARTLSENETLRLFFINENKAFTDGKNIIVDPAINEGFCDREALEKIEEIMNLPPSFSTNPDNALRMITRGQNIHEALHIIYTSFPSLAFQDKDIDTKSKKYAMGLIENIIEDAYIEGVGACLYDNLEIYLIFLRYTMVLAKNQSEGTAKSIIIGNSKKVETLVEYLDYIAISILYPMIVLQKPSRKTIKYIKKTMELFKMATLAESPKERYCYAKKIFNIIKPIIPEDYEKLKDESLESILYGMKTHSLESVSISRIKSEGKEAKITRLLFQEYKDYSKEIHSIIESFNKQRKSSLSTLYSVGFKQIFYGKQFDCSALHNKIRINEEKPNVDLNFKKAYENIYKRYKININSYNSKFYQLLKGKISCREERQIFGTGVSSRYLADHRKRYWYKNSESEEIPDFGVLLLIDGSGSMMGERRERAIISSVILHEVLKTQNIPHAIIEHRARFENPEIDINILVGFNSKKEDKFNLMKISSYGDNRDALALFWSERYMSRSISYENKLIIVISDGVPSHMVDNYYPPASIVDTRNSVEKITKRGTKIIGVSLAEEEELKDIYPNLVNCSDLKRLTGEILTLVSTQLK